jgi:phage virion morphogenesis protein
MTGARISFTLDDRDFSRRVTQLGGALHTTIPRAIGAGLVGVTQQRFETETEPLGGRWQKLNPAYAMIQGGGGILKVSGLLNRTITSETTGSDILIGSNRIYAAVQQFGATIVPVSARVLAFKMGFLGKRGGIKKGLVFARSVHIPARPYLGFGPKDYRETLDVLDFYINKTLSG